MFLPASQIRILNFKLIRNPLSFSSFICLMIYLCSVKKINFHLNLNKTLYSNSNLNNFQINNTQYNDWMKTLIVLNH